MYYNLINGQFNEAADRLVKFLNSEEQIDDIQWAAILLADSFKSGG